MKVANIELADWIPSIFGAQAYFFLVLIVVELTFSCN
jgi:hypothetical protein